MWAINRIGLKVTENGRVGLQRVFTVKYSVTEEKREKCLLCFWWRILKAHLWWAKVIEEAIKSAHVDLGEIDRDVTDIST